VFSHLSTQTSAGAGTNHSWRTRPPHSSPSQFGKRKFIARRNSRNTCIRNYKCKLLARCKPPAHLSRLVFISSAVSFLSWRKHRKTIHIIQLSRWLSFLPRRQSWKPCDSGLWGSTGLSVKMIVAPRGYDLLSIGHELSGSPLFLRGLERLSLRAFLSLSVLAPSAVTFVSVPCRALKTRSFNGETTLGFGNSRPADLHAVTIDINRFVRAAGQSRRLDRWESHRGAFKLARRIGSLSSPLRREEQTG